MTRDDIREGYLVELKNGDKYIVMSYNFIEKDCVTGRFILLSERYSYLRFTYDEYLYDTEPIGDNHCFDIEKVYGLPNEEFTFGRIFDTSIRNLLWQREVKEMTLEEVCDALGYEIKIVK